MIKYHILTALKYLEHLDKRRSNESPVMVLSNGEVQMKS